MLPLRASQDRVFADESIPVLEEEGNRLEMVGDETGVGVFWKGRHTQMETRKDDSPKRRFFFLSTLSRSGMRPNPVFSKQIL